MVDRIHIELSGHLTAEALSAKLVEADAKLAQVTLPADAIFDCRQMHGYDLAARVGFSEWNREQADRLRKVVIITDRLLWRVVVSAMALAARREILTAESLAEADRLLDA